MPHKKHKKSKSNIFGFSKNKGHRDNHKESPKRSRTSQRGNKEQPDLWMKFGDITLSSDEIVGFIIANGGESSSQDIMGNFAIGRGHRKTLHLFLDDMCQDKILAITEDKQYRAKKTAKYHEAILSVNPRGFAFAKLTPKPKDWKFLDDAFVGPSQRGSAIHGDRVLIKIIGNRDDRAEAKIIRVIERATLRIIGTFQEGQPFPRVLPEDERYPFTILIEADSHGAKEGEAVVAIITDHASTKAGHPRGEIVEVLGNPDSLNVQTEIVIRKFGLPHRFSPKVAKQLKKINPDITATGKRSDLRDVLHITIDGEDARDFDDAVAIQKTKNGFQLHVSIADVSHYVTAGSSLDSEAYERGTSVYFRTRVLPMLPEELSNNLCSLVPNQDRYAFTAILDFDLDGTLHKKKFVKSVIKSKYRMTYNLVKAILIDKDPALLKEYKPLTTPLTWMGELANALTAKRMARGSIGFELPEAFIEITEDDQVKGIIRRERNFAHQIIEEFMLAANEAVARTMTDQKCTTGLYRVHELPDTEKVAEFCEFAKTMGLKLPKGGGEPGWFGQILKLVVDTPQEYIINNLLLRTMKQARYSAANVGHFGLAASHYCHFTSPIRRYPDLMVHRALAEIIGASPENGKDAKSNKKGHKAGPHAEEAGEFLSKRERVAVDAEREMVDRMKVRYMEDKVGETFSGIISGVTSFGLFVELLDSFISGGVAISDMKDDYYILDEKAHRLTGKRGQRSFRIGDLVEVKLTSVEKARRRINFEIV